MKGVVRALGLSSFAIRITFLALAAPSSMAMAAPATASAPAAAATSAPSTAPEGVSITKLVVTLISESDPESRQKAAVAILRHSSEQEAVQALLDVLDRPNNSASKLAICHAVAEVRSEKPAFAERLLGFLASDDAALREAAVEALSAYRDPAVAKQLKRFLDTQESKQLIADFMAIAKELHSLLPEVERPARLVRWLQSARAWDRLTALKLIRNAMDGTPPTPPAPEVLVQILQMLADPHEQVRLKLVEVLRDLAGKENGVPLAARLPNEPSAAVRVEIYRALGRMGDLKCVPACISGLKDTSDAVAASAAGALGRLLLKGNGERPKDISPAVDALLARAAQPIPNADLREQVIGAMAHIVDERFLPVLASHAGDKEKKAGIRQAAVQGIGRIDGGSEWVDLVKERLAGDPDAGVRAAAAEALGVLGCIPADLAALAGRLDAKVESDAAVRKKAWEAYRIVFLALNPIQQQAALENWKGNDQTMAGRRGDLLTDLEKQIVAANSDPTWAATVREQLGDACSDQGQYPLAAEAYTRSLEVIPVGQVNDQARVTGKLIVAFLAASDPDKAIAMAGRAKQPAPVVDAVASPLLQHIQAMNKKDPKQATKLMKQIVKVVPNCFGPRWKPKFDQAVQLARKSSRKPTKLPETRPATTKTTG